MRRLILASVAAAALCASAIARQSNSGSQAQPQAQNQQQNQRNLGSGQNFATAQQQISPERLSANQVRDIERALDKMGLKAGRVDGKWGPETEMALKDFQKSKNMPSNGPLDTMTMTALGLNPSEFGMTGNISTIGQAPAQPQGNFGNRPPSDC
jgi:peptidoglycan hydrolase-like protein with peptidoglycan-binding domain